MAERFHGGDVRGVVEAPLIRGRLRDDNIGQFLREHGGKAGFVRQHVEQAAADARSCGRWRTDSSVPVNKNAAVNFRLDVNVVGDFNVVDDGLQNLVHFPWRREQSHTLQAVQHVDFRLVLPFAFRFDRRTILLWCRGLILNRGGRFDRQLAELFFVADVLQVIAPEPGLRLEANVIAEEILQVRFLAEDVRRAATGPAARWSASYRSAG